MNPYFPKEGEKFIINPELRKAFSRSYSEKFLDKVFDVLIAGPCRVESSYNGTQKWFVDISHHKLSDTNSVTWNSLAACYPSGIHPACVGYQFFLPLDITEHQQTKSSSCCSCVNTKFDEVLCGIGPVAPIIKVCVVCKKEKYM
jgi:hypothetical protein